MPICSTALCTGFVWTPKKALENNLAWKCLAGISQFLNPATLFLDFSSGTKFTFHHIFT